MSRLKRFDGNFIGKEGIVDGEKVIVFAQGDYRETLYSDPFNEPYPGPNALDRKSVFGYFKRGTKGVQLCKAAEISIGSKNMRSFPWGDENETVIEFNGARDRTVHSATWRDKDGFGRVVCDVIGGLSQS